MAAGRAVDALPAEETEVVRLSYFCQLHQLGLTAVVPITVGSGAGGRLSASVCRGAEVSLG